MFFLPCEEGDEEALRVGVAISIGEVEGILQWSRCEMSKEAGVVG